MLLLKPVRPLTMLGVALVRQRKRERVYRYRKLQAGTETDAYVSVIIFFSAAGEVSAGNSLRYLAITPATWGAAMDVPNTQNKKIKYGLSNCEY